MLVGFGYLPMYFGRDKMKYDGWTVKNKWGSLLPHFFNKKRSEVIEQLGVRVWKEWEKIGHKIVKVELIEVK